MSQPFERLINRQAWKVSDRWKIALAVFLSWIAIAMWVDAEHAALRNPKFSTGYLLFGAVLFLAAYQWRKKIPTIGFGSSKTWMHAHLGVGWATVGVFVFHVGWKLPSGGLDTLLYILFVSVSASGVFGLYLTRSVPRRLAAMSREVIFERIPSERRAAALRANEIVLESVPSTEILANFYRDSLGYFLEAPRSLAYFLRPNGKERRSLIRKADDLNRYLGEEDRIRRDQLRELIVAKDDLDYQSVLQLRLKGWLFLHIGLTYGLLTVAIYHGLIVHAFSGSN